MHRALFDDLWDWFLIKFVTINILLCVVTTIMLLGGINFSIILQRTINLCDYIGGSVVVIAAAATATDYVPYRCCCSFLICNFWQH